jgi:SSS family solute:Na+ symporter
MTEQFRKVISDTNFSSLDWGIVIAYLMISVVIGLLVKKYASTMAAYIGAGRGVGTWLGIATMTGTELGLITVMYNAELGYKDGFASFHIGVVFGLMTLVIGLSGFIVGPLRREKVLTIPEYYEKRYGKSVRVTGAIILSLAGILNMGVFLNIGSKFIVGITGLNPDAMAVPIVMTLLLVIVLFYTVLGGMISVIITDYIQFVVLSFGMIATTLFAINRLGMETIISTVEKQMASGFNPVSANSDFGISYVTFTIVMALMTCAVWPTMVARALVMESETAVKKQYTWSSISMTMRMVIPAFWGICAFAFMHQVANKDVGDYFLRTAKPAEQVAEDGEVKDKSSDGQRVTSSEPEYYSHNKHPNAAYAMPVFLGRLLPMGLIGVITAAMIAAFMSTHDSYLLCWSSVIVQDVIAPLRKESISVKGRITLTRIFVVVIGVFVWAWGLFYEGDDRIWDYLAVTGSVYFTGAAVILAGGLYWKRASTVGAMAGLLMGATAILGMEDIRVLINEALNMSLIAPQVSLISISLSITTFVVLSLLFPDNPTVDEEAEVA